MHIFHYANYSLVGNLSAIGIQVSNEVWCQTEANQDFPDLPLATHHAGFGKRHVAIKNQCN